MILTADYLKMLLCYDSETGIFTRRVDVVCGKGAVRFKAGTAAGGLDSQGYWRIMINGKDYSAHRLAWLHVFGVWPERQIDHINENKSDNRLENLRLATQSENSSNRGAQKNNTSGFKGVVWHKHKKKWMAQIRAGGKQKYLGLFSSAESAYAAYCESASDLHGDFANTGTVMR